MKKLYVAAIGIVLLCACKNNSSDIHKLHWLVGKWEGEKDSIHFFEEWSMDANFNLSGKGGAYKLMDTLFSEKIKIEKRDNQIYYVPTVPGNNGAVDFKFIGLINDTAIFENPEHDFPQRISYFKNQDGSLYAKVDGKQNGSYSKEEFLYKKIK